MCAYLRVGVTCTARIACTSCRLAMVFAIRLLTRYVPNFHLTRLSITGRGRVTRKIRKKVIRAHTPSPKIISGARIKAIDRTADRWKEVGWRPYSITHTHFGINVKFNFTETEKKNRCRYDATYVHRPSLDTPVNILFPDNFALYRQYSTRGVSSIWHFVSFVQKYIPTYVKYLQGVSQRVTRRNFKNVILRFVNFVFTICRTALTAVTFKSKVSILI